MCATPWFRTRVAVAAFDRMQSVMNGYFGSIAATQ